MRLKHLIFPLLLFAFALRVYGLTEVPPGLTHDEANHGREAIEILDGVLLFYFPLNYGSEPLYSYTVAGLMGLLGENLFSLRYVNLIFSLLAMAISFRLGKKLFDVRVGLLTAVLIAIIFWPLASSREALRAGMLPFFMTTAVWFFWQLVTRKNDQFVRRTAVLFGVSVAITLHIYLAARVAWLLFPLFLVYLSIWKRPLFHKAWRPTLGGLLLAGLLVIPMFTYVQLNPEVLTRLDMLDGPLDQIRRGDFLPVLNNAFNALLAFWQPGYGDQFLAYNIPGRPVFDWFTAVFFILGLLTCLWRWRDPRHMLLLLWFGVGIIPSLITGPTANTTRNLAALVPAMMLPAVGFTILDFRLTIFKSEHQLRISKYGIWVTVALWLSTATFLSTRDYFVVWGQSPEVRSAYQHTLVESLAFAATQGSDTPLVISSVYPGPVHDASITAVLTAQQPPRNTRWIDARSGLILPAEKTADFLIPASTPLHPTFASWLEPQRTITLRDDDLDPTFTQYAISNFPMPDDAPIATFNNAVALLQAEWQSETMAAGETAVLLTIWQVLDPTLVGPIVPPAYTTDINLFTHVLRDDGTLLTQADALGVPSWSWQTGDLIYQLHTVHIPAEAEAGSYQTIVGLYDRTSGVRGVTENGGGETAVVPLIIE